MTHFTWRVLVLLAALQQFIFPVFVNPFADGQAGIGGEAPSQIEPAGYAFSIWGLIYSGALAFAVWQLARPRLSTSLTPRIAPYAIALYIGSSVWLAAAKFGPLWATMPILIGMTLCAVTVLWLAVSERGALRSLERTLCLVVPFGLYAGWTLCATFVNIAEVAPGYGFDRFGLSVAGFAVLSLCVLTLLAAAILWTTRGNLAFAATVLWALTGILVAGREREVDASVLFAAGGAMVAVVVMVAVARRFAGGGAARLSH